MTIICLKISQQPSFNNFKIGGMDNRNNIFLVTILTLLNALKSSKKFDGFQEVTRRIINKHYLTKEHNNFDHFD